MSGVRLNVTNLAAIKAKMQKMRVAVQDMDPLWDRIADVMVEETTELWASEGETADPPWAPLAESTIKKKMKMGLPLEPMVESGALFASLIDKAQAGALGQGHSTLGTFTTKQFSWGTDVENDRGQEYAPFHQEGPEHNPNLPVRNVINVTPALLMRVQEEADEWIREIAREAGLT